MRIIGGKWRARKLSVPEGPAIRPTLDRVREAWMSVLQFDLPDARVLDLYAGSGALGLEALSRGAAHADFVDKSRAGSDALKSNIALLGAGDASTFHRASSLEFVRGLGAGAYDVAFADPPYEGGEAAKLADAWLLRPFSRIFGVEHAARETMPPGGITRRYGTVAVTIYRMTQLAEK